MDYKQFSNHNFGYSQFYKEDTIGINSLEVYNYVKPKMDFWKWNEKKMLDNRNQCSPNDWKVDGVYYLPIDRVLRMRDKKSKT